MHIIKNRLLKKLEITTRVKSIAYLFFVVLLPLFIQAQGKEYSEYEIKAVYLERFTRFIEWPKECNMSDTTKPFIISIFGKNPFGTLLQDIYSKYKIKNKRVEVRYISRLDEIPECHLLFISESKENLLPDILSYIDKKPILTIGDTEGFIKKGIQINLFQLSGKIRFEINTKELKEAGLYISSLLLKMAKETNGEETDK